jgi:hypothetical protein
MKYINWGNIKTDFLKWMPWSATIAFYWFVVWNDYISSMLNNYIPEIQEQNPFSRNEAMHFVLHKGMIVDLLFGSAIFLSVLVGYHILKHWNKVFATIACNGFLLYWSFDRLTSAVIGNYLYALHMYVKDPHSDIMKMFGL